MAEVVQIEHGVNSASFATLPKPRNGIIATMIATAAVDLSGGILLTDNQGNILSQVALFEFWDMIVGHQSLAIGFYGLSSQPREHKGKYTVSVKGLPAGRNGATAALAIFEVNGLRSLDQTGSNGSTGAMNSVATGTSCAAINTNAHDLVIAALAVPDSVWSNAPRYPPGSGYAGIFTDVINPAGSGIFADVQAAYKVVDTVETSSADWGSVSMATGYAWPWVSAVASFNLARDPRTSRRSLSPHALAAVAPLAWVIHRRQKRAPEIED